MRSEMLRKPVLIDLFCGCGGFGLGAKQAGFEVHAAIDIDATLQSAYKRNFPQTQVIQGDLATMGEIEWKKIIQEREIDGVIGGPPCQGYSRIGKGDVTDVRRLLLGHFFRNVNLIQPKFFVMENVEGLLDARNIDMLQKAIAIADPRYTVLKPVVVDASKFGAPTKRKRVIVVGYDPDFVSEIQIQDFLAINHPLSTVKDAIADLPSPISQSSSPEDLGWTKYPIQQQPLSSYAKKMRKAPQKQWGCPESIAQSSQGLVSGNFETIHSPKVADRYAATEQGKTDAISRSKKLAWDGFCPTLRAGTGSDKGSYQAVRPLHPSEGRVITVREAARLQGFPDWFCFHPAKWHSFRMIGNSVSPLVSEGVLSVIKHSLMFLASNRKVC